MGEPNDRIVLVTGANRGIGRAIAQRFLAEGWMVIAAVRADAGVPGGAQIERCDLRERASVDALAERVRARFGRIDVLINNAAIFEDDDASASAAEVDPEVLRRTLDVNVVGTVAVTVALLPLIPRGGRVVNLASDLGQFGKPGGMTPTMVAYSMSKAALNAYTSALANALRERAIRVDSVHPGWVKTEMGGPHARLEPEEGAERVYRVATRADGETGRFWKDDAPAPW